MKKYIWLIAGIVVILAGIGVILYPVITQARTAAKQRELMDQIKQDILNGVYDDNTAVSEPVNDTDPKPVSGDVIGTDDHTSDLGSISFENMNLEENTDAGEATDTYDKSKLRGQKCLGIISCEKINIVYAIVEGIEDWNLLVAIGHFPDSAAIGTEGNCALAGHSGGHLSKFFQDLKDLEVGDELKLTDLKGDEYTYNVIESFIVKPEDVYVVQDLGKPGKFLTMVTCTTSGSKRLIVRAQCTTDPVSIKEVKD